MSPKNFRLPIGLCAAVADVHVGSHTVLDLLFEEAGAPGPPPDLAHNSKWKHWLHRAGKDPDVDSLEVLGNLLEEFMDLPPLETPFVTGGVFDTGIDPGEEYGRKRQRIVDLLEKSGLRYFYGGQIIPIGQQAVDTSKALVSEAINTDTAKPSEVEEVLNILVRSLPRAIHPLTHRRKGATHLSFESEYDIQDLLHSQMRPWISDIRPEECTPSYAGTSTRMDFLLPKHEIVIETKRVRDKNHAKRIGDELIIDIEHYRRHPNCKKLYCVIYDPNFFIENPTGMAGDLEGLRETSDGTIDVKLFIFGVPN